MADAAGNLKGSGWTRKREAGWERAFGSAALAVPVRPARVGLDGCARPALAGEPAQDGQEPLEH